MGQIGGHYRDEVIGPEERLVATRFGGNRPALLMIVCYRKVFGDRPQPLEEATQDLPTTYGLNACEALASLEKLLAAARDAGLVAPNPSSRWQERRARLWRYQGDNEW